MPKSRSRIEAAYDYNRGMRDGLQLVYNELNKGQKQKLLKNEAVKAMFEKFRVRTELS